MPRIRLGARGARLWITVISAVLVAVLTASCGGGAPETQPSKTASADRNGDTAQVPGALGRLGSTLPDLVARVEPSVVTVLAGQGQGSGVVYRDGGYIVTNRHVVEGQNEVVVALADGSRTRAEVFATDALTDLAVVRAERRDLPPARFADRLPRRGEPVLAVGSPLGFENSVTAGIVSGLGREIPGAAQRSRALVDLIQTDAAISPGNSGGALIDMNGEVVGINEAYLPPETGAVALGFAIPAATVTDTVDELLEDGEAEHAFLGVQAGPLTPEIADSLGVPVDQGVVVLGLTPGGPAEQAGVREGDVLVRVGGEDVTSVEGLVGALRGLDPGQEVDVELVRNDEERTLRVTVGEAAGGG